MAQVSGGSSQNYETFRDCLSTVLIERLTKSQSKRRRAKGRSEETAGQDASGFPESDAEELAEFVDYIATEVYESFPDELKNLDHYSWAETRGIQDRYALPLTGEDIAVVLPSLDPSISDSLVAYGAIDGDRQGIDELLAPVVGEYITAASAPPPPPRSTRTSECEICGRDWIDLSYHHLIPRFVHEKVTFPQIANLHVCLPPPRDTPLTRGQAVKRGWHREEELQNVAWLCGACHRFVHQFAKHEDLARYYYTVDLLLEQPEIHAWANWVGRLRWKSGKTRSGR